MHPRKEKYTRAVFNIVSQSCLLFSSQEQSALQKVLHLSNEEAYDIIGKIMIALPDCYFYNANQKILYDMLAFIGKRFMLFQAQENINDKNYPYSFIHFIKELTHSVGARYYPGSESMI